MRTQGTTSGSVQALAFAFCLLLATGVVVGTSAPVSAAETFVVTSLLDITDGTCDADCTFREALIAANADPGDDVITFAVDGTITLTSDLPDVATNGSLTVTGNGPANTTIDGNGQYRSLFRIQDDGANVTISDLRATGGLSTPFGGAIDIDSVGGVLQIDHVVFDDNESGYGGALNADDGAVVITNSVVRNNTGTTANGGIWIGSTVSLEVTNSLFTGNSGAGGAIRNSGGAVTITNSTIVDNSSSTYAAGISSSGALTIRNSILARNVGGDGDCGGGGGGTIEHTLVADGTCGVTAGTDGNLTGDPLLSANLAPTGESPVVNAGDNSFIAGFGTDLAGETRVQSGTVDLGAYESAYPYVVQASALDGTGSEAGDQITFRVSRSLVDSGTLDVAYTLGGTAEADDYTPALTGTVTIPADADFTDIVLTPVDDTVVEGDETVVVSIEPGPFYVVEGGPASATITDNDTAPPAPIDDEAGIAVAPTSGLVTSEGGGTDTFSIVLTSEPTGDVTIALESSDTTEGTIDRSSVVFTTSDWDTPQVVMVSGVDDLPDDGDIAYSIVTAAAVSADANYDALDPTDVSVTNLDVDAAGPSATLGDATGSDAPQVGDPIVVTIEFDEEPLDFTADDVVVGGTAGAAGGTLSGGPLEWTFTIPPVSEPGTVTLSLPAGAVVDAAENPNTPSDPLTINVEAAPATTTTTTTTAQPAPTTRFVGELPVTGAAPGSVLSYALLLLGTGAIAMLIASARRPKSSGGSA